MNPTANATGMRLTVEASKLFVHPALELRVERPRPRPRHRLRGRVQRHASSAERRRRQPDPDERQHPREQVEPVLRRLGQHRRPELRDELRLISLFVSPAAIRAEMYCRIRSAIGADDWSSVVLHVGHITSPSSSPSVGWRSLASAGAASPSASSAATSEQSSRLERALDPGGQLLALISPWIRSPTSRPSRPTKYVSGKPVTPYLGEHVARAVVDVRVVSSCGA